MQNIDQAKLAFLSLIISSCIGSSTSFVVGVGTWLFVFTLLKAVWNIAILLYEIHASLKETQKKQFPIP